MLLYTSLIASMNVENTTEWNTEWGRYWQTVSDMGLFPVLIIGIILLVTGITFSLWGVFSKEDKQTQFQFDELADNLIPSPITAAYKQ